MQSYCLIPILLHVFINSVDRQTAQSLYSILNMDDFTFLFCYVLTFQWNRKAQILKMCHELTVWISFIQRSWMSLYRELWMILASKISTRVLPTYLLCNKDVVFWAGLCKKVKATFSLVWVSHTPLSRTIGSQIMEDTARSFGMNKIKFQLPYDCICGEGGVWVVGMLK